MTLATLSDRVPCGRDNCLRAGHRLVGLSLREDFGRHAAWKPVRVPRWNVILVELPGDIAERRKGGMTRYECLEKLGDGMADDDTLAGQVVERLQGLLGRLLAHEATLRVEALASAERGKREIALGLREPASRFSPGLSDGARSLRAALA